MLLNRVHPFVDTLVRINKNGFKKGQYTVVSCHLTEGINSKNLPAVLKFVDFRKAFESIHRGMHMEILTVYGIPTKTVLAISMLHTEMVAQVLSSDRDIILEVQLLAVETVLLYGSSW